MIRDECDAVKSHNLMTYLSLDKGIIQRDCNLIVTPREQLEQLQHPLEGAGALELTHNEQSAKISVGFTIAEDDNTCVCATV